MQPGGSATDAWEAMRPRYHVPGHHHSVVKTTVLHGANERRNIDLKRGAVRVFRVPDSVKSRG